MLPSYMKIKEDYTFWQMMQKPEIAAKVTLLPVDDLGVDAGILFSDILVIPHALGMGLEFNDSGPLFDQPLAYRENPLAGLNPDPSKLNYIYEVILSQLAFSSVFLLDFLQETCQSLLYLLRAVLQLTSWGLQRLILNRVLAFCRPIYLLMYTIVV